MSLTLNIERMGGAAVLRCNGRIVFRDEVMAFSKAAGELLEECQQLVLDFAGVTALDSAGLGELVALHMWAQAKNSRLKIARPSKQVVYLLELTNLTSILSIVSSQKESLLEPEAEVA